MAMGDWVTWSKSHTQWIVAKHMFGPILVHYQLLRAYYVLAKYTLSLIFTITPQARYYYLCFRKEHTEEFRDKITCRRSVSCGIAKVYGQIWLQSQYFFLDIKYHPCLHQHNGHQSFFNLSYIFRLSNSDGNLLIWNLVKEAMGKKNNLVHNTWYNHIKYKKIKKKMKKNVGRELMPFFLFTGYCYRGRPLLP